MKARVLSSCVISVHSHTTMCLHWNVTIWSIQVSGASVVRFATRPSGWRMHSGSICAHTAMWRCFPAKSATKHLHTNIPWTHTWRFTLVWLLTYAISATRRSSTKQTWHATLDCMRQIRSATTMLPGKAGYSSTSFLSALQPWVSLGLLNNQSPFLSIFHLLHPLLYVQYFRSATTSSIHLKWGLPFLPTNNLPSIIFLGIAPTSILFTCPSHLVLWAFMYYTMSSPFMDLFSSSLFLILQISPSWIGL